MIAAVTVLVVFGLLLSCLTWPLGIGVDYMNHLARVHIERELDGSHQLQEFYYTAPGNIPDLVMDIFIGYGFQSPDIYLAGTVMVFFAIITLPLAGLLLAFKLHGRIGGNHLLVFAVAFPFCLRMGFVNFQIALGLSLLCYTAWISVRSSLIKLPAFAVLAVMLYFFHVLGFLVFGFLVLAAELGEAWRCERLRPRDLAMLFLRLCFVFLTPVVLLIMTLGADHGVEKSMNSFGSLAQHIHAFSSAFGYGRPYLALFMLFAAYVYLREFADFSTLSLRDRTVLVALAVLVALMPWQFLGISYLEVRYAPLLFVMIFAMAAPCTQGRVSTFHAVFALSMTLVGFASYLGTVTRIDAAQSELRQSLASLPAGSRLLTGMADDYLEQPESRDYVHSSGMHVIENDGFVTSLFTNTSPVKVRSDYGNLQRPQGFPLLDADLSEHAVASTQYSDWRSDFGYLLWMRSVPGQYSQLSGLKILDEHPGFVIYKIE